MKRNLAHALLISAKRRLITLAALPCAIVFLCVTSCSKAQPPVAGTMIKAEVLKSYGVEELRAALDHNRMLQGIQVGNGIKTIRLLYWTTNYDGRIVMASGLLALPDSPALRGVVSFQHGTIVNRQDAPSVPKASGNYLEILAGFAGGGYLTLAPDYIGMGSGKGMHPYLHADTEANAVIDLLKAAKSYAEKENIGSWPTGLFLFGISQGGHASMAAHRALERIADPAFRVTASAPVVGAYELATITLPYSMRGKNTLNTLLVADAINSYAKIYKQPLSSLLEPTYAASLPRLFDGRHSMEQIVNVLPRWPRQIFLPDVYRSLLTGGQEWLVKAIAENDLWDWRPLAPVRLYYCAMDGMVAPENSTFTAGRMSEAGADVEAISLGGYDHNGAILALPLAREWFDSLSGE